MRKQFFQILTASVAIASIASCKKDSNSRQDPISGRPWKVVNIEYGTSAGYSVDPSWSSAPSCEKDNLTYFKSNGNYEVTEGATKCNAADPDITEAGTWAFRDNESKIVVEGEVLTIQTLDENQLQLTGSVTFGGTTIMSRATLSH